MRQASLNEFSGVKYRQTSLSEFGIKAGINMEKELRNMRKISYALAGALISNQVAKSLMESEE